MLLYNSPVSGNGYKVRLLLAHLGLGYETVDMSVVDRSNRPEVLGDLTWRFAYRRSSSTMGGR